MTADNYDNIPKEMRALDRWCLFRIEEPEKPGAKPPKVPYKVGGQSKASNTDAKTLSPFLRALPVPEGFHGINFAFMGDGLAVVDLDHAINKAGDVAPWAWAIIERIGSYTEVSYSGTGFHVVFKCKPLERGRKFPNVHEWEGNHGGVEVYSTAKFISVTGTVYADLATIKEHDVIWLIEQEEQLKAKAESTTKTTAAGKSDSETDFALMCKLIREHGADHSKIKSEFVRQATERTPLRAAKIKRPDYVERTLKAALAKAKPEEAQPCGVVVEESPRIEVETSIPQFPRLTGALGLLVEGITPDIPYDHKALAVLTYVGLAISPRVRMEPDHWLQTRFYGCAVAEAASCKSAADNEAQRALLPIMPHVNIEVSMDSGPALVECLKDNPITMLAPDELGGQFEKARAGLTGRNSLFDEFLRLYEGNRTGNRTKKGKSGGGPTVVTEAYFAIFAGATTRRFTDMFTGTGANASGLQSRFVLSYADAELPRIKTPNDEQAIEAARQQLARLIKPPTPPTAEDNFGFTKPEPITLRFTGEATAAFLAWRADESMTTDGRKRILDHVKRFAMLVAACNGDTAITGDVMRLALQFGDYQIAVRELLLPPDAGTTEQAFENAILKHFEKEPVCSKERVVDRLQPKNRRGGFESFNRAWAALTRAGQLLKVGENRKHRELYSVMNPQGEQGKILVVAEVGK